jgi:hypothetical protein
MLGYLNWIQNEVGDQNLKHIEIGEQNVDFYNENQNFIYF